MMRLLSHDGTDCGGGPQSCPEWRSATLDKESASLGPLLPFFFPPLVVVVVGLVAAVPDGIRITMNFAFSSFMLCLSCL